LDNVERCFETDIYIHNYSIYLTLS